MKKQSAGLLVYRYRDEQPEMLLVHPGGPFFVKKDMGVWSVPKGEFEDNEAPLDAAKREFAEEVGVALSGNFTPLKPVKQKNGKVVYAWAVAADIDVTDFKSNEFTMEWPMKSGKFRNFPEVDRVEWFSPDAAKEKINAGQVPLIDELMGILRT